MTRRIAAVIVAMLAVVAFTLPVSAQTSNWTTLTANDAHAFTNVLVDDDILILLSYTAIGDGYTAGQAIVTIKAGTGTIAIKAPPSLGRRIVAFYKKSAAALVAFGDGTVRACIASSPVAQDTTPQSCSTLDATKWHLTSSIEATGTELGEVLVNLVTAIQTSEIGNLDCNKVACPNYVADGKIQRDGTAFLTQAWGPLTNVATGIFASFAQDVPAQTYEDALGKETPLTDRLSYDRFPRGGTTLTLTRNPIERDGRTLQRICLAATCAAPSIANISAISDRAVTLSAQTDDDVVIYYIARHGRVGQKSFEGETDGSGAVTIPAPVLSVLSIADAQGVPITGAHDIFSNPYRVFGLPSNVPVTVRYTYAVPGTFWADVTGTGQQFGLSAMATALFVTLMAMGLLVWFTRNQSGSATPVAMHFGAGLLALGILGVWPLSLTLGVILVAKVVALRTLFD